MDELKLDDVSWQSTWKSMSPDCEKEMDDDAESIITNQRYAYISKVVDKCVQKKAAMHSLTTSDKIDRIVTNRILALPIFAVVMFAGVLDCHGPVRHLLDRLDQRRASARVALQGDRGRLLEGWGVAPWLQGLIVDGIVGGVGAVLGFVPQMLVLFLMLVHSGGRAATWPVSPSSWTASSASSACPARALSPCSSAPAAACPASWPPAPLKTSATAA